MAGDEPMFAALADEFMGLSGPDRRAILARLRFDERLRFEAALRRGDGGCSADLAALADDDGARLTPAARAALIAALPGGATAPSARPSLFDRMVRR